MIRAARAAAAAYRARCPGSARIRARNVACSVNTSGHPRSSANAARRSAVRVARVGVDQRRDRRRIPGEARRERSQHRLAVIDGGRRTEARDGALGDAQSGDIHGWRHAVAWDEQPVLVLHGCCDRGLDDRRLVLPHPGSANQPERVECDHPGSHSTCARECDDLVGDEAPRGGIHDIGIPARDDEDLPRHDGDPTLDRAASQASARRLKPPAAGRADPDRIASAAAR